MFLGQMVAGYAFRVIGVFAVCLLNGITYLTAGITESFARIPQHIPTSAVTWRDTLRGFRKDIREGFSLIWRTRGLRVLVLTSSLMSFVLAAVLVVIPFYVSEQLQQRDDWVGFLSAAYGIGSLVGYLAASFRELHGVTRAAFVVVAMFLQSLITLALGVVSSAPVALAVVFVGGVFGGFTSIYVMTIVQSTTPSEVRGRIFGFLGSIAASLAPLGMGVGGFVFDGIGQSIPLMYLGCGVLMILLVLVLASNRHVRAFLATDTTLPSPTSPPSSFHPEGL
jgi:MFS family permease